MTDKTVSHAIERGIDFLFANRLFCGNEPRLWEDFDLLLGPSDEWVTAYAARALLHTNEERSVWAAREAVHALLIEQSSTGKALTDGSFTVLFSTTPLSASRNYSVNIPSVNAFECLFFAKCQSRLVPETLDHANSLKSSHNCLEV
jgi:hypothetical protein